jgi:hypothetical protein
MPLRALSSSGVPAMLRTRMRNTIFSFHAAGVEEYHRQEAAADGRLLSSPNNINYLTEIAQMWRRLALLRRHQPAIGALEVVFALDADVGVVFRADVGKPHRARIGIAGGLSPVERFHAAGVEEPDQQEVTPDTGLRTNVNSFNNLTFLVHDGLRDDGAQPRHPVRQPSRNVAAMQRQICAARSLRHSC